MKHSIDLGAAFPNLDAMIAFTKDVALINDLPLDLPSDHRKAREEAMFILELALQLEAKKLVKSYHEMAEALRTARARVKHTENGFDIEPQETA